MFIVLGNVKQKSYPIMLMLTLKLQSHLKSSRDYSHFKEAGMLLSHYKTILCDELGMRMEADISLQMILYFILMLT